MMRYLTIRFLTIILTVLCVIFILFALLYILPGSYIRMMPIYGGGDALDSVYSALNVTDSLFTKYIRYCYDVCFHFSFASSATTVHHLLGSRVLTTLLILASGLVATLIVGIPAGVYLAIRNNKTADHILSVVLQLLSSLPSYITSIVVLLIFASYLRIIPVTIYPRNALSYFMPTLTITIGGASSVARMTKANLLDVLGQPYIIALQAKGLQRKSIIYRHALKNALIPIVSYLRGFSAQLICGTLVVERFFSLRGAGTFLLNAVSSRNHFEILACTVILTVVLSLMNVAADVFTAIINPFVRLRYRKGT